MGGFGCWSIVGAFSQQEPARVLARSPTIRQRSALGPCSTPEFLPLWACKSAERAAVGPATARPYVGDDRLADQPLLRERRTDRLRACAYRAPRRRVSEVAQARARKLVERGCGGGGAISCGAAATSARERDGAAQRVAVGGDAARLGECTNARASVTLRLLTGEMLTRHAISTDLGEHERACDSYSQVANRRAAYTPRHTTTDLGEHKRGARAEAERAHEARRLPLAAVIVVVRVRVEHDTRAPQQPVACAWNAMAVRHRRIASEGGCPIGGCHGDRACRGAACVSVAGADEDRPPPPFQTQG